jgi:hypothetical protein
VHVTRIARLPVREHTLSQANHRVGVAGHPLGMKRRCHQAALALPEVALAGQKALTEDGADMSKEEGGAAK